MSQFQTGMNFYGQMPDSYTIVLNSDHALVKKVLGDAEANTAEALKPILAELKGQELVLLYCIRSRARRSQRRLPRKRRTMYTIPRRQSLMRKLSVMKSSLVMPRAITSYISSSTLLVAEWYAEGCFSRCILEEKRGYD